MLGLFHGQPGGRIWRRALTEGATRPGAGLEVIDQALDAVSRAQADMASRDAARRDAAFA